MAWFWFQAVCRVYKSCLLLLPGTLKRGSSGVEPSSSSSTSFPYPTYNWAELQRGAAHQAPSDADSVASAATLVDGTPLTPQQLGLMGMEALETVASYWEDALATYNRPGGQGGVAALGVLVTAEEAEFVRMLEALLEAAYQLQVRGQYDFT